MSFRTLATSSGVVVLGGSFSHGGEAVVVRSGEVLLTLASGLKIWLSSETDSKQNTTKVGFT